MDEQKNLRRSLLKAQRDFIDLGYDTVIDATHEGHAVKRDVTILSVFAPTGLYHFSFDIETDGRDGYFVRLRLNDSFWATEHVKSHDVHGIIARLGGIENSNRNHSVKFVSWIINAAIVDMGDYADHVVCNTDGYRFLAIYNRQHISIPSSKHAKSKLIRFSSPAVTFYEIKLHTDDQIELSIGDKNGDVHSLGKETHISGFVEPLTILFDQFKEAGD